MASASDADVQTFQVFVRLWASTTVVVHTSTQSLIASIAEEVARRERLPVDVFRLSFRGRTLDMGDTVASCGITRESTIHALPSFTPRAPSAAASSHNHQGRSSSSSTWFPNKDDDEGCRQYANEGHADGDEGLMGMDGCGGEDEGRASKVVVDLYLPLNHTTPGPHLRCVVNQRHFTEGRYGKDKGLWETVFAHGTWAPEVEGEADTILTMLHNKMHGKSQPWGMTKHMAIWDMPRGTRLYVDGVCVLGGSSSQGDCGASDDDDEGTWRSGLKRKRHCNRSSLPLNIQQRFMEHSEPHITVHLVTPTGKGLCCALLCGTASSHITARTRTNPFTRRLSIASRAALCVKSRGAEVLHALVSAVSCPYGCMEAMASDPSLHACAIASMDTLSVDSLTSIIKTLASYECHGPCAKTFEVHPVPSVHDSWNMLLLERECELVDQLLIAALCVRCDEPGSTGIPLEPLKTRPCLLRRLLKSLHGAATTLHLCSQGDTSTSAAVRRKVVRIRDCILDVLKERADVSSVCTEEDKVDQRRLEMLCVWSVLDLPLFHHSLLDVELSSVFIAALDSGNKQRCKKLLSDFNPAAGTKGQPVLEPQVEVVLRRLYQGMAAMLTADASTEANLCLRRRSVMRLSVAGLLSAVLSYVENLQPWLSSGGDSDGHHSSTLSLQLRMLGHAGLKWLQGGVNGVRVEGPIGEDVRELVGIMLQNDIRNDRQNPRDANGGMVLPAGTTISPFPASKTLPVYTTTPSLPPAPLHHALQHHLSRLRKALGATMLDGDGRLRATCLCQALVDLHKPCYIASTPDVTSCFLPCVTAHIKMLTVPLHSMLTAYDVRDTVSTGLEQLVYDLHTATYTPNLREWWRRCMERGNDDDARMDTDVQACVCGHRHTRLPEDATSAVKVLYHFWTMLARRTLNRLVSEDLSLLGGSACDDRGRLDLVHAVKTEATYPLPPPAPQWTFRDCINLKLRMKWLRSELSSIDQRAYEEEEADSDSDEEGDNVDCDEGFPRFILRLKVHRNDALTDCFNKLLERKRQKGLRGRTLAVSLVGEEAIGHGVKRELMTMIAHAFANQEYGLLEAFQKGRMFYPSRNSDVNPLHIQYFRFLGRVLGLCLHDDLALGLPLPPALFKAMRPFHAADSDDEGSDGGDDGGGGGHYGGTHGTEEEKGDVNERERGAGSEGVMGAADCVAGAEPMAGVRSVEGGDQPAAAASGDLFRSGGEAAAAGAAGGHGASGRLDDSPMEDRSGAMDAARGTEGLASAMQQTQDPGHASMAAAAVDTRVDNAHRTVIGRLLGVAGTWPQSESMDPWTMPLSPVPRELVPRDHTSDNGSSGDGHGHNGGVGVGGGGDGESLGAAGGCGGGSHRGEGGGRGGDGGNDVVAGLDIAARDSRGGRWAISPLPTHTRRFVRMARRPHILIAATDTAEGSRTIRSAPVRDPITPFFRRSAVTETETSPTIPGSAMVCEPSHSGGSTPLRDELSPDIHRGPPRVFADEEPLPPPMAPSTLMGLELAEAQVSEPGEGRDGCDVGMSGHSTLTRAASPDTSANRRSGGDFGDDGAAGGGSGEGEAGAWGECRGGENAGESGKGDDGGDNESLEHLIAGPWSTGRLELSPDASDRDGAHSGASFEAALAGDRRLQDVTNACSSDSRPHTPMNSSALLAAMSSSTGTAGRDARSSDGTPLGSRCPERTMAHGGGTGVPDGDLSARGMSLYSDGGYVEGGGAVGHGRGLDHSEAYPCGAAGGEWGGGDAGRVMGHGEEPRHVVPGPSALLECAGSTDRVDANAAAATAVRASHSAHVLAHRAVGTREGPANDSSDDDTSSGSILCVCDVDPLRTEVVDRWRRGILGSMRAEEVTHDGSDWIGSRADTHGVLMDVSHQHGREDGAGVTDATLGGSGGDGGGDGGGGGGHGVTGDDDEPSHDAQPRAPHADTDAETLYVPDRQTEGGDGGGGVSSADAVTPATTDSQHADHHEVDGGEAGDGMSGDEFDVSVGGGETGEGPDAQGGQCAESSAPAAARQAISGNDEDHDDGSLPMNVEGEVAVRQGGETQEGRSDDRQVHGDGVLGLNDLNELDPEVGRSLEWVLSTDLSDGDGMDLGLTFSVDVQTIQGSRSVDLIEGGSCVAVVESNKHDYVRRMVKERLRNGVAQQVDSIREGLLDVIDGDILVALSPHELASQLCGTVELDVRAWAKHTVYNNCSRDSEQVEWFWSVVQNMTAEERITLLQFVTASRVLPAGGFKALDPRFCITICDASDPVLLPTAATCFATITMPPYPDEHTLRQRLMTALRCTGEGFGFL